MSFKPLRQFLLGFSYAVQGIMAGFEGRNFRLHTLAALGVMLLGLWLGLTLTEWWTIFILFALVLGAELFNSAIEELANTLRDNANLPYRATQKTRDLAAGAVLIISIFAAIIGWSILWPKLWLQLT